MNPFNPSEYFEDQKRLWDEADEKMKPYWEQQQKERERKENFRFWLPTIIAIIALIVAGISLFLQAKGK